MTAAIESMFTAIDEHCASVEELRTVPEDFLGAMKATAAVVSKWCKDNHLTQKGEVGSITFEAASESFKPDTLNESIGPEKLRDLCTAAGVAPQHTNAACKRVAALLNATLGRKSGVAFEQFRSNGAADRVFSNVAELFPGNLYNQLQKTASLEGFGITTDRVEPDLKTILSIALLQFHTNLIPRIMPIQTVAQGNVTLTRESLVVYDMSDSTKKTRPTRVLELYTDPSMVSTRAIRIKPLKANDAAGNFLLADDVYLFKKTANMFELALTDKPGFDKYGYTDLIEDNICLDGVLLKLEYKASQEAAAKDFFYMLPIPASRGRLTQLTNDLSSTDRRLALDRFSATVVKGAAAATVAGCTSDATALNDLADGVYMNVDLHAYVHADRRNGKLDAVAYASFKVAGSNETVRTDDARAAIAAKFTLTLEGFTVDARYNEDNKRKTSILAEVNRRSQSYELPAGRNFVIDSAIGQDGVLNAAAHLAHLEHIGRDFNALTIIEETMAAVHDANVALNNDEGTRASLAAQFAAGDLVNPYVYNDTFDLTGIYGIRSADASGDVKQYVKTYFNRLTSALETKTFFKEQLAAGATVTFRVITSPNILGDLFMVKHIHENLETSEKGTGGVESVLVLDNGVRLEIVTTTFNCMKDKIMLIPFLPSSPNSVLNFAQDYDMGTLVGAISVAGDGGPAYHRMFSVTRELPIPMNVIGAVITVVGAGASVNMSDANSALTVTGVAQG